MNIGKHGREVIILVTIEEQLSEDFPFLIEIYFKLRELIIRFFTQPIKEHGQIFRVIRKTNEIVL